MRVRSGTVGSPKARPNEDNWGNDWDDDWDAAPKGGGSSSGDGWGDDDDWENPRVTVAKAPAQLPRSVAASGVMPRRDSVGSAGGGSSSSADYTKENTAVRPAGRRLPVRMLCFLGALFMITLQGASRAPALPPIDAPAPAVAPAASAAAASPPPPLPAARHRHDGASEGAVAEGRGGGGSADEASERAILAAAHAGGGVVEDKHPGCGAWSLSGECMKNPGCDRARAPARAPPRPACWRRPCVKLALPA
jgi:hypothetical protein